MKQVLGTNQLACLEMLRFIAANFGRQLVIFLLLILMLSISQTVLAHGGGELQITSESVGPHLVSVWTNPPRARAGEVVHVTVGVAEQGDQSFVLDAEVLVEVFVEGEDVAVISTTATTDRSTNKLFYETDFTLPDAAQYTVVVTVSNENGGGAVDFNMPVGVASNRWFGLIGVAALGGVGVLIALSRRRGQEETAVPRRNSRRPV